MALGAGCGGTSSTGDDAATAPVATGPTDDLAPSQLTAETAPPPEVPPRCEPDRLTVWTAQVRPAGTTADAVLRVRNDADVRCEADVSGSPFLDPDMEPDVWLDAGGWADLVIGTADAACADRVVVPFALIDVNGERFEVPTAAVVGCGWRLTAFYPDDDAVGTCDELATAVVDGAILLRNDGPRRCRLGRLAEVRGDDVVEVAGERDPAVTALAAGDVVAIAWSADDGCPERDVVLGFDAGPSPTVAIAGCAVEVETGAPGPWIGGPGGPAAATLDASELLAALDPFAG